MPTIPYDANRCQTDVPPSLDSAFIGFYTTPQVKAKVVAVAEDYGVSVAQLLCAFAAHADTLCWCVPLGDEEAQKESRQPAS